MIAGRGWNGFLKSDAGTFSGHGLAARSWAIIDFLPSHRDLRDPETCRQVLAKASVQEAYRKAFEITLGAIHREDRRRGRAGKIPNLQLYDMLGALAQSCGSHDLLARAREELSKAAIQPIPGRRSQEAVRGGVPDPNSAPKSISIESAGNKTIHSRHSHRKKRAVVLCRRQARIARFRFQRLDDSSLVREPKGGIDIRLPHKLHDHPGRGTWDPKLLNNPELQISVHVVRQRKHARKGRQRRRKGLDSC